MKSIQSQTYRPTTMVLSPRAAHGVRLWWRWIHLTRDIIWADPRWPSFIRRWLYDRRVKAAKARFGRWLDRHPYAQQPLPNLDLPGVSVSKWLPPGIDAVEFRPDDLRDFFR